jgi:hypothetical protein
VADRFEQELRELGRELAFPPEPDVASWIADRLRAEPEPRRLRPLPLPRRRLVLALAVLALALVTAFAVPPVRAALLDLFGIGGVTIERVEELPRITPTGDLGLGAEVSLAEARGEASFPVKVPDSETWGRPDGVYLSNTVPGGRVSLLYGTTRDVRLLVTEFRGQTDPGIMKKAVGGATRIEFLRVRGLPGYWLTGAPHAVVFRDENGVFREDRYRLAKNVLLWEEDGVTYRIEGDMNRRTALEIADGLR